MDSDIGKSTDRISKLHDSILCHILAFLPTKYAVGTSILSTRWRYLWTCAPNPSFDFDDSLLFHEFSELTNKAEIDFSFRSFVNRVLLLTDATCFKKFRLLIESVGNSYDVDTWICTAIKRKVQELELEFCMCLEDDYKLPHMLFTSKTLVVLKLDEGLLLEVPVSVWLPSLKILHLKSVDYEKKDSFQTLFSGCPVLEELYLEKWVRDDHQVLNISVPTLKSLKLMCAPHYFRDEWEDESDGQGFCVVINAFKLEQLKLIDHISEGFLVENLPSLLTARVHLGPNHLRPISNNDGGRIYKLLSGVANVKFLDAALSFPSDVNSPVIPTFHNLTHLTLGGDVELESAWNWNWLTDFLECSPNLKVLTFKRNRILGPAKCWNPPQKVPNCLLLHLEEIEIKEFHAEEYVLEVMIYLLKNAKVLKKMTVDFRNSNIKEECRIWQKMLLVSRGSTTCLLNLIF